MPKKAVRKVRPAASNEVSQSPEIKTSGLAKLMEMIGYTQENEASCDEVDRILDQFAELVKRGEDVEEVMPLVKNHVDLCPECREEFDALLRILQNQS
jgi:hypothetical protein